MDQENPQKHNFSIIIVGFVIVLFSALVVYFIYAAFKSGGISKVIPTPSQSGKSYNYQKFASDQEFRDFVENKQSNIGGFSYFGSTTGLAQDMVKESTLAPNALSAPAAGGTTQVERTSQTNVQVLGIDEPDIAKTDGQNIYYSSQNYTIMPLMEKSAPSTSSSGSAGAGTSTSLIAPAPDSMPRYYGPQINVITATPPSELGIASTIQDGGDMLLSGNTLVVLNNNKITAYDVSDSAAPSKKWGYSFDSRAYIQSSRLFNDQIYVVSSMSTSQYLPCPIPLMSGVRNITISCTNIYHPTTEFDVDSTYTVTKINPTDGNVENTVSFVGSSSTGVIYMSPNAIYTTFTTYKNSLEFINEFLSTQASDLFPQSFIDDLNKVAGYDISEQSKMNEFSIKFSKYLNSTSQDESARIQNELANRMSDYLDSHGRDLVKTGIVKINTSDLAILSQGEVPGSPLNQFSLDEYQGNLRIATTISAQSTFGRGDSANDVYVLDNNLNQTGSIKNLGITERIYSVRFVNDKGYVVTFRQTDPFYVLGLSDPNNPKLLGQLKIPGYSSYLHPISDNMILGVGQDNSNSKITLFSVSDPSNPTEMDTYSLNEYWSEVQNNHHAFLLDSKHNVFLMPAGSSGYVFSYANNKLSLEHVVSNIAARRAVFINDYLYVLGDSKVVVLNESDWSSVNSLDL